MNTGFAMAQFTAGSTARRTLLQLGFVPDFALVTGPHTATNPNILWWANKGGQAVPSAQQTPGAPATMPAILSQWLAANDHLLLTGSSGVITRVTDGIAAYFGGETIEEDETINSNPVHPFTKGNFPKAGAVTGPGIEIPATILTANGLYIVLAFRRDGDDQVASLAS